MDAEAAKDSTTPHLEKLTGKKEVAAQKLAECTMKIREHLDELEERRPTMLVKELSSIVGIQASYAERQYAAAAELVPALPHSAVAMVRRRNIPDQCHS